MSNGAPEKPGARQGLLARLQALPEPRRRSIARILVILLTLAIVTAWIVWHRPITGNPESSEWETLVTDLESSWQVSQATWQDLQKNIQAAQALLAAPENSDELKQVLIEQYTNGWNTFTDTAIGYSFKYPADTRIATATPPTLIQVLDGETELVRFTLLPTSSPMVSSSTTHWQTDSSTIAAFISNESATSTFIIETFKLLAQTF